MRVDTLIVLLFLVACGSLSAQQNPAPVPDKSQASIPGQDEEKPANTTETLQKATQNPVANLISVPLQNNSNFDVGPYDRAQNVLNIRALLESSDGDAAEAFLALEGTLAGAGDKPQMDALGEAISNFDFAGALLKLDEITKEFGANWKQAK